MQENYPLSGGKRTTEATSAALPLVSIITVVCNNEKGIEQTIQSVVRQTFKNFEYLIIDGKSKDRTYDLIKKHDSSIDFWISEADKGIYDAMNKGLKYSRGKYVWFINSGDLIESADTLEKIFAKDKDADVYYGETNLMDEQQKVLGTRSALSTRKLPEDLTWRDMKYGMLVSHQSIVVKKELTSLYNLEYKCSADIDWVIASLKNSRQIVNTKMVLSRYLVGGFSASNDRRCWEERFKVYMHHYGLLQTLWVHGYIVLRSLFHKVSGKRNY